MQIFSTISILVYGLLTYLALLAFAIQQDSKHGIALAVVGIAVTYLFQFLQFVLVDETCEASPAGNVLLLFLLAASWIAAVLSFTVTLIGA